MAGLEQQRQEGSEELSVPSEISSSRICSPQSLSMLLTAHKPGCSSHPGRRSTPRSPLQQDCLRCGPSMRRPGLVGGAEQGPPPLPALLCKTRFVPRAGQPQVPNSGFNLPGIHPSVQAQPTRELGTQQGQENIVMSPQLTPVEGFTERISTAACGWRP